MVDIQDILREIRWGLGEKKPASWFCLIGALMVLFVLVCSIVNIWVPIDTNETFNKVNETLFMTGGLTMLISLIFITLEA